MQVINADNFYDAATFFSFLIVSCGPDGELGMHEPNETGAQRLGRPITGSEAIYDNLTNKQPLRSR
jgi:hypothetical protein